jgi:hypothetical protein
MLVPSTKRAEQVSDLLKSKLGYSVFGAEVIEQNKKPFISSTRAAAVLANRYDGIDFPGDECRLLVVDGMARAVNLQERFLFSRMGAAVLLGDRVLTRIVQAFGRCTRSATDYACVVVLGQEVLNLLSRRERRELLHPELQAELEFGMTQSASAKAEEYLEYLKLFLEQGSEWQEAGEAQIQSLRSETNQHPMEGAAELAQAAPLEIAYQERMWNGDFEGALTTARRVASILRSDVVRGYRALWNYLAASAAYLATHIDGRNLDSTSKDLYWAASRETSGIAWLKRLSQYSAAPSDTGASPIDDPIVERMEIFLDDMGAAADNKLVRFEKQLRDGLAQTTKGPFEKAHEMLGRMLGYDAGNKETPGAPDPWWIVDDKLCLIFEDHSDAKSPSLDVTKARQVASHPTWVRANLSLSPDAEIIPILVSPVAKGDRDAIPHLRGVSLWPLEAFRSWAENAISAFEEARNLYPGQPGDLAWRAEVRAIMNRNGVDLAALLKFLNEQDAQRLLSPNEPQRG